MPDLHNFEQNGSSRYAQRLVNSIRDVPVVCIFNPATPEILRDIAWIIGNLVAIYIEKQPKAI